MASQLRRAIARGALVCASAVLAVGLAPAPANATVVDLTVELVQKGKPTLKENNRARVDVDFASDAKVTVCRPTLIEVGVGETPLKERKLRRDSFYINLYKLGPGLYTVYVACSDDGFATFEDASSAPVQIGLVN